MSRTDSVISALTHHLDDDAVLPETEVRQILGLSRITLHRMRQRDDCGGLPYVRLSPGRLGYLRRDVRAFIVARRVGKLPEQLVAA
jgi:hypothetical protein